MRTHLSAFYRGERVTLAVSEVTHFTADSKYVVAHHKGGQLLLDETLASLEAELPEFIRTHRSTLARRSLITAISSTRRDMSAVTLAGVTSPVRASRRHAVTIRRLLAA